VNAIEIAEEPAVVEAEQYVVPDAPTSPLIQSPETSPQPSPRPLTAQYSNPIPIAKNDYNETCL